MKIKELTLEQLKEFGDDVYKAIEFAREFRLEYPDKPKLDSNHTSKQLKEYNKAFGEYEFSMKNYEELKKLYNENDCKISSLIEKYIKDISGFNELPEKAKDKVWRKAWNDCHSEGYHSVYYQLCELVDLFN